MALYHAAVATKAVAHAHAVEIATAPTAPPTTTPAAHARGFS